MTAIPTLTDGVVTLRAPHEDDVEGVWEQCQDPLTQRWTSTPVPYSRDDARTYLRHIIPGGWDTDREWCFVLEAADEEGTPRFGGTVSLRNEGFGRAEIAFGAHPGVRGRGLVERALRLLLEWGFVEQEVRTVLWLAHRGNWRSRRLAWRLGFVIEGSLRGWVEQRGELRDAWVGTLRQGEPLQPRSPWLETPRIHGRRVVLRALEEKDLPRIVETLNDPVTQHWLQRPRDGAPHTLESAARFVEVRLEQAAAGSACHWAVADPEGDSYLGQVSVFGVDGGRRAEVGYWAHPDARGRGVIKEACRLVVRHCFVDSEDGGLGLHRLVADAGVDNTASHRILEAAGFRRTGLARQELLLADGTVGDAIHYDQLAGDLDRHDW